MIQYYYSIEREYYFVIFRASRRIIWNKRWIPSNAEITEVDPVE